MMLSLVCGSAQAAPLARQSLDRIVAVIGDEIITERELETRAAPYMTQLEEITDETKRTARRTEILRQVLDIEISDKIVSKELESNRDKLGVTDKDVDRAVDEVLKMNRLSLEDLQSALYGQGLTWAEYRTKLRAQLERARLIQYKVQGRVQLKDTDVKRRCEERQRLGARDVQVCASHILFKVAAGMTHDAIEDLRARASKIQAELSSGADFAAYALKYSDDKGTPDGRLGCFRRGDMVQAFEDMAFSMRVGEVSPVVRTDFGFHIIKLWDRKTAAGGTTCDNEQDLEPFRNELYQEEMERQMKVWIDELRRKSFVEVRL